MQSLFTERHAIEIAYKNLEDAKIKRRNELRADMEKFDIKENYILERLQVLDKEQPIKERPVAAPPQNNFPIIGKDVPRPETLKAAEIVINELEKEIKKKPKANKPGPKQKPKQITETEGAALLIEILEAATEPVSAKYIAEQVEAKTGRKYASIHDNIKRWTAKSGGRIQKIGTKYSIR